MAWEVAATKLKVDGCACLKQKWIQRRLRSWFNMLSWLDGKPPTMEVIGYYSCMRCESWCVQHFTSSPYSDLKDSPRAKSRYDRYYRLHVQDAHPKVPLWDALCFCAVLFDEDKSLVLERAAFLSRLVGREARQQVEQQLRSRLVISDTQDITYMPYINDHYPGKLRQCAAWLSCTAGLPLLVGNLTHDVPRDIPDGLLDDAPLAVILGANAWIAACLRSPLVHNRNGGHDEGWHSEFQGTLQAWFETFTEYPLPKLSLEGVAFCAELYFGCAPQLFGDEEPKRTLKTFLAVAIFLRKKSVLLHCCRRCQVLFAHFFSDTALSASLSDLSLDSDESGMSFSFMSDINNLITEDIGQELDGSDGVPDFSLDHAVTRNGEPLICEDLVGMEAFTDVMISKNLTKEELQSQLTMKFNSLVCISDANLLSFYNAFIQTRYADSIGLNLSACLPPSCSSGVSPVSGPM